MRRLFVVSALIAGLLSMSMPTAWAAGPEAARVEGLRGTSSVRSSVSAAWQNLDGGLDVGVGGALRTSEGAEALVNLPGGVVLRVAPSSELEVSRLADTSLALRLQSGRVFATVPQHEGLRTQLEVQTPTGRAVSSGAEFTVDAGQKMSVRVLSGLARVAGQEVSMAGVTGQSLEVPAGTEAIAQNAGGPHDDADCDCRDKDCRCQKDSSKCHTDECTTWKAAHPPAGGSGAGGGTGAGGVGAAAFPVFAVLGGLGLLGIIALVISDSSEVQSE